MTKTQLNSIYEIAISEYLGEVYKKHQLKFDTLYFGKHDQLPELHLPPKIGKTQIIFLDPEDGEKIQKERPTVFYINMVGWGDQNKHEFIFVTFSNASAHQFDCFLTYVKDEGDTMPKLKEYRYQYYAFRSGK